jgi:hypothetical protein
MATKPKNSLFGCFSDPPIISTDENKDKTDPYLKTDFIPSRYLGKNLATVAPSNGRLPTAFFGKTFLTLASREQNGGKDIDTFEDPGRAERRAVKEAKKKNIVEKDFKVASYPKQSTGPGSYFGCFAKPIEHQPEYKVVPKDQAPDRPVAQPKNIKSAPGKHGTYGFVGTTFEKPQAYDPNRKPDPFGELRKKEFQEWEESKKKNLGGNFKLSGKARKTFDEKFQTGVSAVFDAFEAKEDTKKKKKSKAEGGAPDAAKKGDELKPFRYSSAPKSGEQGFLNKFANSRGDKPEADPYDSVRLKRKEEKAKAPKPLQGSWKPVSGPKKSVMSSLLRRFY